VILFFRSACGGRLPPLFVPAKGGNEFILKYDIGSKQQVFDCFCYELVLPFPHRTTIFDMIFFFVPPTADDCPFFSRRRRKNIILSSCLKNNKETAETVSLCFFTY
jgi:hypothetical protein